MGREFRKNTRLNPLLRKVQKNPVLVILQYLDIFMCISEKEKMKLLLTDTTYFRASTNENKNARQISVMEITNNE